MIGTAMGSSPTPSEPSQPPHGLPSEERPDTVDERGQAKGEEIALEERDGRVVDVKLPGGGRRNAARWEERTWYLRRRAGASVAIGGGR